MSLEQMRALLDREAALLRECIKTRGELGAKWLSEKERREQAERERDELRSHAETLVGALLACTDGEADAVLARSRTLGLIPRECPDCDGVGWVEGGKAALQTHCVRCDGKGLLRGAVERL